MTGKYLASFRKGSTDIWVLFPVTDKDRFFLHLEQDIQVFEHSCPVLVLDKPVLLATADRENRPVKIWTKQGAICSYKDGYHEI